MAAGLFADDGGDDAGWRLGVEFMPLDDGIGSAGGGVVSVVGAALGSVVAGAFPDGIASCAMAGAASIKEARTRIIFITGPFKRGYRATVTFESINWSQAHNHSHLEAIAAAMSLGSCAARAKFSRRDFLRCG